MTLRVLDLETTGIDASVDAIVEIAAVDITRDWLPTNHQSHLVNPGRPIPTQSSAVHHILDEDVKDAPALDAIMHRYKGASAYVAHNADFEASFLVRHGFSPWVCTYKSALRIWPELPSHSNQFLRYHLGLANPFGVDRKKIDPHRALSDCLVTGAILAKILKDKLATWGQMVAWSAEPPLTTIIPFSKQRGVRWDEVDEGFLHWVLKQPDMDESHTFSAKHWLAKRGGNS